jgi:hypothetical protein
MPRRIKSEVDEELEPSGQLHPNGRDMAQDWFGLWLVAQRPVRHADDHRLIHRWEALEDRDDLSDVERSTEFRTFLATVEDVAI